MIAVLEFLTTYEAVIFVFLGIAGLVAIRRLFMTIKEWRSAIYGLEKEAAQRRFGSALTLIILLMILALAEFSMVTFVAPAFPNATLLLTPTMDLLASPTTTLNPLQIASAAPAGIPTSINGGEGCIPGQLDWSYPANGDEISGLVELKGTVNVVNLGFFKYEFSQPGSDAWITIAAGNQAKIDEPLGGVWNTSQLVPGDYLLRLVVSDNQNILMTPCTISVRIIAP